jgi:hypothetical protein
MPAPSGSLAARERLAISQIGDSSKAPQVLLALFLKNRHVPVILAATLQRRCSPSAPVRQKGAVEEERV